MAMCYYGLFSDEEERKIGSLSLEPFASARIKKLFTPDTLIDLCDRDTVNQSNVIDTAARKGPKSSSPTYHS
jgi:hypothetical protein